MSNWIPREIANQLKTAVSQRPAVALTGARQTGKTSLLTTLFPDYKIVSLDLPSEAEAAELDSRSFLENHGNKLIIDEVQYAPKLFRHLKSEIDKQRNINGQFLLTGSQKFSLMKELSDSLAGRIEILELETLSVQEITNFNNAFRNEELILRGGFPELYANQTLNPINYHRSYLATYLERDVRQLLNVSNLRDFERFIRACALRTGQLLNKAELARDTGINPTTANDWLSVLQASNQIYILEPWFTNRTKTLVKTPKLYFADCGLLCTILNITTVDELIASPLRGAIWETFVFSELRKQQVFDKGFWQINFWRERNNEIDFFIDRGGRYDLFEAKWSENPDEKALSGFKSFAAQKYGKNINLQSVICRTATPYPINQETKADTILSWSRQTPSPR